LLGTRASIDGLDFYLKFFVVCHKFSGALQGVCRDVFWPIFFAFFDRTAHCFFERKKCDMWPFYTDEEVEKFLADAEELDRPLREDAARWKTLSDEEKLAEMEAVTWDDTLRFFGILPPEE
jgi:hypothetical protein